MICAFLNQKGGAGKTTLAIHAAAALAGAAPGFPATRVLLVDADAQGSALDWSAARGDLPALFSVIGLPKPLLHKELPALGRSYDHIVIDGSPRLHDVTRSALLAADVAAIPVQPSPYDVWAAKAIVDLIAEARVFKESLKAVFAINRKIANTAIGRDVAEALAVYEGIPALQASICQRVAFAESAATGRTVFELDATSPASLEAAAMVKELLEVAAIR
jgi:chromosome partitioning protein